MTRPGGRTKQKLGEVETWSGIMWALPRNLSPIARLYPTFTSPYKGEETCRTEFGKKQGTNTHGKPGNAIFLLSLKNRCTRLFCFAHRLKWRGWGRESKHF